MKLEGQPDARKPARADAIRGTNTPHKRTLTTQDRDADALQWLVRGSRCSSLSLWLCDSVVRPLIADTCPSGLRSAWTCQSIRPRTTLGNAGQRSFEH